jgi:ferredoxin
VQDFIGNHGGFNGPNAPFQYDRDTDCWLVSTDDWQWWNEVIVDNQNLADRILSLSKKHGSDAVAACIASCGSCDLEDHAALVNAALDENF